MLAATYGSRRLDPITSAAWHKTSEEVQAGFKDPETGELLVPQEPGRNNRKSE